MKAINKDGQFQTGNFAQILIGVYTSAYRVKLRRHSTRFPDELFRIIFMELPLKMMNAEKINYF
jgi:hypothetical protein